MHTIFLANLGGGQSHNRLVLGSIVALVLSSAFRSDRTHVVITLSHYKLGTCIACTCLCLNMLNIIFLNYYEKFIHRG